MSMDEPISPEEPARPRLSAAAGLLLLLIRGVLLWLTIPLSVLAWPFMWPVLRRRRVNLGQFLGWVDLNLVASIERSILRPLIRAPFAWTSTLEMSNVTHRIALTDPA